jgi:hypothetical protein
MCREIQRLAEIETKMLNAASILVTLLFSGCIFVPLSPHGNSQDIELPPFRGTIFDFADLIKPTDPTAFQKLRFVERSERNMFDRRIDGFQTFPVFVFEATFRDRNPIEVAVNREFETEEVARQCAELYAAAFGRLPLMLRKEIDALHIQAGKQLFGGGRNILIHTDQAEEYASDGILEETLGHEAGHALDEKMAMLPAWLNAQKQDARFISTYAAENPYREDIAESIIPYLAVRFRPERITKKQLQSITNAIPARIDYFDSLKPEAFPQ